MRSSPATLFNERDPVIPRDFSRATRAVSSLIIGPVTRVRTALDAHAEPATLTASGGLSIVWRVDRRSPGPWRGHRLAPLALVLLFLLSLPGVSRAGTFTFPVQTEQVVTGTTTGIGGAQTDDGTREVLFESEEGPITLRSRE